MRLINRLVLGFTLCCGLQACTATSDGFNTDTGSKSDGLLIGSASGVSCDADAATFEDTMLSLINESRRQARMCGDTSHAPVGMVGWNNKLRSAAIAHGRDMATNNFFSHDGSNGLGVDSRAEAENYNWFSIGENIAAGRTDMGDVHQGWLDSPGHCRNIMNTLYTEVGAACITTNSADYSTYWVVVFGDQL